MSIYIAIPCIIAAIPSRLLMSIYIAIPCIIAAILTKLLMFAAPIMPPQSMLIKELNATFVVLDLTTWLTGGCPILSYDIRYQIWGDDVWETVESYISPAKVCDILLF